MRILIGGAGGLIGRALCETFGSCGHQTGQLVRGPSVKTEGPSVFWNPDRQSIDLPGLNGFDAVIHLGGANIAAARWTPRYRKIILESRTASTSLLARSLASLPDPPAVFLCASAAGFYGFRPAGATADETTGPGTGFLSEVCQAWEAAAEPARQAGIRVCHLRFGIVLSPSGGVLAKVLPVFRAGLGGRLGHGRQMMPWIAREDIPPVVQFLIETKHLSGPVNVAAPGLVDNAGWTRLLARALRRPAFCHVPARIILLLLGQMGRELLLEGAGLQPRLLLENGYRFRYPGLEEYFRHTFRSSPHDACPPSRS